MLRNNWLRSFVIDTSATAVFVFSSAFLVSGLGAQTTASATGGSTSNSTAPSTFVVAPAIPLGYVPSGIASGDLRRSGMLDLVTADYNSGKITVFLGAGQGNFSAGVAYDAGPHPSSVAVADIDGDGVLDVLACSDTEGTISVLPGAGDGTFRPRRSYAVGFNSSFMVTGDLGGNGKADVAVAGKTGNQLAVLLNDGNGGLQKPIPYTLSKTPAALTLANLNGDGFTDIALANQGGTVSILLGMGAGQFRPLADISVASGPLSSIVAGDFNNDGKIDLAVAQPGQKLVSILIGKGDGTFISTSSSSVGNDPLFLLKADVGGDGVADLIAVNQASNTFSVLIGNGDGTFKSAVDFVAGNAPVAAVAGDFYGNGHADLAIINQSSQTASLPLGNGDGTFQTSRSYAAGLKPASIASGNLNGNKTPGLVVANYCGSDPSCGQQGNIAVFLADDQGVYRLSSTYSVGAGPVAVALADVNGDGSIDILALNRIDKSLSILRGAGDGTFGPPITFPLAGAPVAVAAGDLNNDGKPDLAVLSDCGSAQCSQPGSLTILIGAGDGNFQSTVSYPVGYATASVAVGDINGDKNLDIVAANRCGNDASCLSPGTGTVLIGDGTGKFTPGKDLALGNSPSSIALGSLSGSGMDLVVSRSTDNTLAVLKGNGDGSFQPAVPYPVGAMPGSVVVADFNGDGHADVAVTNMNDSTVSVLFGRGDGTLQAASALPVGSGPQALAAIGSTSSSGHASLATASGSMDTSAATSSITVVANLGVRPMALVNPGSVTLAVTPAGGLTVNQGVTLTATVSGSSGTPTGNLQFQFSKDGGSTFNNLADCGGAIGLALDGTGAASCATQQIPAGAAVILQANYLGNGFVYNPALSNQVTRTVTAAATTVNVTADSTTPEINHPATLTAIVQPAVAPAVVPDTVTITGTVAFLDNSLPLSGCSEQPVAFGSGGTATATCANHALSLASHSISAQFIHADSNYLDSPASSAINVTVGKETTTLTVAAPAASPVNTSVTFTATLHGTFTPVIPTSTVAFYADGSGTAISGCNAAPISASGPNYVATCTTDSLNATAHIIVATYTGDGNFAGSSTTTSATYTPTKATPTISLARTSGAASVVYGTPLTFTATVSGPSGSISPTSTVIFYNNGSPLACTGGGDNTLSGSNGISTATCAISSLPGGNSQPITASYAGDTNFNASAVSAAVAQTITPSTATVTIALTTGTTPANYGTALTFTATVDGVSGLASPTGTVTFTDGFTPISCTNAPSTLTATTPGIAKGTCDISTLTGTSHSITTNYVPGSDPNYSGNASAALQQIVNKLSTTVVSSSSVSGSSSVDQSVTFTATVSVSTPPAAPALAPSGTVSFTINGNPSPDCPPATVNSSGKATCTTSALTAGPQSIVSTYNGDSNYNGSISAALPLTVNKATTTTVVALTSGTSPATVGQSLTFTATVTPPNGSVALGGTVTFTDAGASISACSSPVSLTWNPGSGTATATCTTSAMIAGNHGIVGVYNGDSNYIDSTSATVSQTVNKADTTVSALPAGGAISVGDTVTFTATAAPNGGSAVVPFSGTMLFSSNGTAIAGCTAQPVNTVTGVAACTTATLLAGTDAIAAAYSGDANYNASPVSAPTAQTVNKANTTTSMTPVSLGRVDDIETFTATVAPNGGSAVVPFSGTMMFSSNGTAITGCTAQPVNAVTGVASCSTATLLAGSYAITGTYSGDSNYNASPASAPVTKTVNKADTTTVVVSSSGSPASSTVNQSVTFTVTVTPPNGTVPLNGTVTFTDGGNAIAACSLPVALTWNAGSNYATAACSTAVLTAGMHQIVASYDGDSNYNTSTSATVAQTVNKQDTTATMTPAGAAITYGGSVTFAATVSPNAGSASVPFAGTILFASNGTPIVDCSAQTVNATTGAATCTTTTLLAGSDAITATYSGDPNYKASSVSAPASQTVNKATPTVTVTPYSVTYDGNAHTATGSATGVGGVALSNSGFTLSGTTHTTAGSYATDAWSFTDAGGNYATASGTVSDTIAQATPAITWSGPAAIVYGTALSTTQLNATSDVPGTFAYNPAAGTVLAAGPQTLSVAFTPSDTTDYASATKTVSLTVTQAAPVLSLTCAQATYDGNPHSCASSATGVGSATVSGTWSYSPSAATNAGSTPVTGTFTSSDANYANGTASGTLVINAATATLSLTCTQVTYDGNPHSCLGSATGIAGATVTGTWVYSPASVTTAGVSPVTGTFTASDSNYIDGTATGTLTIDRATPPVTWAAPAAITYGTTLSTIQLNASSAVAGTIAYSPAAGTVLNAGSQTLTAAFTPTDAANYTTASKTVSLAVNAAAPTLALTCDEVTYDGNPHTCSGAATGLNGVTVAGTWVFNPASQTGVGSYAVTGTFTSTDSNYTSGTASGSLIIDKATPTVIWAAPPAITYGTALSALQLNATSTTPGSFTYSPVAGTMLQAGLHMLSVTFTPTDSADYVTATKTVSLTVNQATSVVTWATFSAIIYGTALSATQLNATASVPGTFTYNPAAGTTLSAGSNILSVTFTPTDSIDYTTATASVTLIVNNPVAIIGSLSPAFTSAGGAAFTLTVNGQAFISTSTVYWGSTRTHNTLRERNTNNGAGSCVHHCNRGNHCDYSAESSPRRRHIQCLPVRGGFRHIRNHRPAGIYHRDCNGHSWLAGHLPSYASVHGNECLCNLPESARRGRLQLLRRNQCCRHHDIINHAARDLSDYGGLL